MSRLLRPSGRYPVPVVRHRKSRRSPPGFCLYDTKLMCHACSTTFNYQLTFRFDNERHHEDKFHYKPSAVDDIIPPAYGFNCPWIHELVECHSQHDRYVLGIVRNLNKVRHRTSYHDSKTLRSNLVRKDLQRISHEHRRIGDIIEEEVQENQRNSGWECVMRPQDSFQGSDIDSYLSRRQLDGIR